MAKQTTRPRRPLCAAAEQAGSLTPTKGGPSMHPLKGSRLPLLALAASILTLALSTAVAAQSSRSFTAGEVVATLEGAGLNVDDLRQQDVARVGPSGPPGTEQEAWGFSIPSVAPSGGRIMVFGDERSLEEKAEWFRRADATVLINANIILWLDSDLPADEAARYQSAFTALQ
jgi:hypothetical protein